MTSSKVYHCQHNFDAEEQILQNEKNSVNSTNDCKEKRLYSVNNQDTWPLAMEEEQRGSHSKDCYTCKQVSIWKNMKQKLPVKVENTEYNRHQKEKKYLNHYMYKGLSRNENNKCNNIKNILKSNLVKGSEMNEMICNQSVPIYKRLEDQIEETTLPFISDISAEGSFTLHSEIYCTKNKIILKKEDPKYLETGDLPCNLKQYCPNGPLIDSDTNLEQNNESQERDIADPNLQEDTVNFDCFKIYGLELLCRDLYPHNLNSIPVKDGASLLTERITFHTEQNKLPKRKKEQKYAYCNGNVFLRKSDEFSKLWEEKEYMKVKHLFSTMISLEENPDVCSMSLQENNICTTGKMQLLPERYNESLKYVSVGSKMKLRKLTNQNCSGMPVLVRSSKQIEHKKKEKNKCNPLFAREMLKTLYGSIKKNKKYENHNFINTGNITLAEKTTYVFPQYPRTCNIASLEAKQYRNLSEMQKNANFCFAKNSPLLVVDTFEKISLSTDFEELNKITFVTQNSVSDGYSENSMVSKVNSTIKSEHNGTDKLKGLWISPGCSSTDTVNCDSGLLQDGQDADSQYLRTINIHSQNGKNKRKDMKTLFYDSNSENTFHIPSNSKHSGSTVFGTGYYEKNNETIYSHNSVAQECLNEGTEHNYYPRNEEMSIYSSQCSNERAYSKVPNNCVTFTFQTKPEGHFNKSLSFLDNIQHSSFCLWNSKYLNMKPIGQCSAETKEIVFKTNRGSEKNENQIIEQEAILKGKILPNGSSLCKSSENAKTNFTLMNDGCSHNMALMYTPAEDRINNDFELKTQFDLVLEELRMFHEISREQERNPYDEKKNSTQKYVLETSNKPGDITTLIKEDHNNVSQNKAFISSFACAKSVNQNISNENHEFCDGKVVTIKEEKKVPFEYWSSKAAEDSLYSTYEEVKENTQSNSKSSTLWVPAFLPFGVIQERNSNMDKDKGYSLSHGIVRVQPLITCNGPIRIGLSKKAKTKQLHPYLK
ncbi:RAD51-associated protein 2 [Rhinatrema bivittatum]|uniref:RAD51-associated protein 2 n=1 Tax=Rhinatrema bivittatum TaxID=194408 RepID=UPI00112CDFF0|nr:RAD51-associated protein 2 [Rhinatrema bivittatum]